MLSPDATLDEYRAELKALNKPFMGAGCCACEVADDLLDDIRHAKRDSVKTGALHVQSCPVCQSTLPPIPVELPMALEAVSA